MKLRRFTGFSLCLALGAAGLLIMVNARDARADYEIGLKYFKQGKYNEALQEFRKQTESTPDWHFSRYMTGICLIKLKKLDEAAAALEEAMLLTDTDKDKFKTLDGLGKVYSAKRQYDKAAAKFAEATALQVPGQMKAVVYEECGDVCIKRRKYKDAEVNLGKAASLRPDDKNVQYKLGLVRLSLQNYDGAVAALEKANSLNHGNLKWMERLGDAYLARAIRTKDANMKKEYYSKAAALGRKGLEINSASFEMNELLGNAQLGLQQYDAAIRVLSQAVSMKPGYGEAYYNLAQAFAAKQDYQAAETNLKKARGLMPEDAAVFSSLGFVYEKQKRLEESRQAYEMAVKLRPSSFNQHNLQRVIRNIEVLKQNKVIEADNVKVEQMNKLIELENQRIEMENAEAQRVNAIIEQEFGDTGDKNNNTNGKN